MYQWYEKIQVGTQSAYYFMWLYSNSINIVQNDLVLLFVDIFNRSYIRYIDHGSPINVLGGPL